MNCEHHETCLECVSADTATALRRDLEARVQQLGEERAKALESSQIMKAEGYRQGVNDAMKHARAVLLRYLGGDPDLRPSFVSEALEALESPTGEPDCVACEVRSCAGVDYGRKHTCEGRR